MNNTAIGEKSANAVNDKYRGIHPSYVGNIDINTCSSSDPGMSGVLTPFVKMYGKFFSPDPEPQTWDDNFRNLYLNYFNCDDLPIYSLDYFYNEEKKSRKVIKQLENIKHFINNDPYNESGLILLDVTKNKIKKLKIGTPGTLKFEPKEKVKKKRKPRKPNKKKQIKSDNKILRIKKIK